MRTRSRFRKEEAGQVLVFVILAMLLAGLVIPPILGFGYMAHSVANKREERMLKLYAADAGVQDAYRKIIAGNPPGTYNLGNISGYTVNVQITPNPDGSFHVVSTASDTTIPPKRPVIIESNVGATGYGWFFDNVITSWGNVSLKQTDYIEGNVSLNGCFRYGQGACLEEQPEQVHGNVTWNVPSWPDTTFLRTYYQKQVVPGCTISSPIIVPNPGNATIGNCTALGSLTIEGKDSSQNKPYGNVTLTGTVYVNGNLEVKNNVILDLNYQTIYVQGDIDIGSGSYPKVYGPGCIVAEGDIFFKPKETNQEYVFIMSVEGTTTAQPQGNFTGSFAGSTSVDLAPGVTLEWIPYPKNEDGSPALNFPGVLETFAVRIWDYIIRED